MRSFVALGTLGVMLLCLTKGPLAGDATTPAAKAESVKMNPRLAALGDDTWINLGLPRRGGTEVPAVFAAAQGLFWKYGGCCDDTPPVKISFPKGDCRYPNGYSNTCWALEAATLQWRQLREYDCSWPTDRPANGCSRGYCYDSKRGVVWMFGGVSDGGGGGDVQSLWTYDAGADRFENVSKPPAEAPKKLCNGMAHDPVNDLVIFATGNTTWVYHCGAKKWEGRSTPGAPGTGSYEAATFDLENRKMVLPRIEPTGQTSPDKKPDTRTTLWKQNGPKVDGKRSFQEHVLVTWTYDAAANKWEKLAVKPEDSPPPRSRPGVAYDSLNKVVILVGGSTDTWDKDEKQLNDTWVLDVKAAKWTEQKPIVDPLGAGGNRDCRQCAYDPTNNVVFFQPIYSTLRAYRYKKAAGK